MRANLLPRRKARFAVWGVSIDRSISNQLGIALALVISIAGIGFFVGSLRERTLERAAETLELRISVAGTVRAEAKSLALDVARYQEYEREQSAHRRSGDTAAIEIARIGNAVPQSAWLDTIGRTPGGAFDIAGGSRSAEVVGRVVARLQTVLAGKEASLVRIEDRGADGVRFDARVDVPTAAVPSARETPAR